MMASCLTLKRSYDHDREGATTTGYEHRPNPSSAKRPRRHFPVTVVSSSNETDETSITDSSVFPDIQPIVTADALLTRIKEEVRRLQRRHQLKSHHSSDTIDDETSQSSASTQSTTDASTNAQHLLTLKQVNLICSRLLKEREETIREEYDRILSLKLDEQHENFVRFTQDQLTRRFSQLQFSYVS